MFLLRLIYKYTKHVLLTFLSIADRIAYTPEDTKPLMFGTGFDGGITDLQVGPDGYLYVLTLREQYIE